MAIMSTLRPIRLAAVAVLLVAACVIETVPLPEGRGPPNGSDGGGGDTTLAPRGDPLPSGVVDGDPYGAAGDPGAAPGDSPAGDSGTPAPAIVAVDGNGSPSANTGSNTAHFFADGLVIYGTALDRATVELAPSGGTRTTLVIRQQSASRIEVELPLSLAPGDHTLTVSNAAGSAQAALVILQGVPGAACPE
jgi:hypothetical protein